MNTKIILSYSCAQSAAIQTEHDLLKFFLLGKERPATVGAEAEVPPLPEQPPYLEPAKKKGGETATRAASVPTEQSSSSAKLL